MRASFTCLMQFSRPTYSSYLSTTLGIDLGIITRTAIQNRTCRYLPPKGTTLGILYVGRRFCPSTMPNSSPVPGETGPILCLCCLTPHTMHACPGFKNFCVCMYRRDQIALFAGLFSKVPCLLNKPAKAEPYVHQLNYVLCITVLQYNQIRDFYIYLFCTYLFRVEMV